MSIFGSYELKAGFFYQALPLNKIPSGKLMVECLNKRVPHLPLISLCTEERVGLRFNYESKSTEVVALRKAGQMFGNWNLEGLSLYVTLEPCLMCAGAILQSKISRVIFGAFNSETTSQSSVELLRNRNPQLEVVGGVNEDDCSTYLTQWFSEQRKIKR
jgi:pyrimidine deaminase RibD-like protein